MSRVWFTLLLAVVLCGCEDDNFRPDPTTSGDTTGGDGDGDGDGGPAPLVCGTAPAATAEFATPASFDTSTCPGGAFAGRDLAGSYFLEEPQNGFLIGHTRVDDVECGVQVQQGITNPYTVDYTRLDDDSLFWRREGMFGPFRFIEAVHLCEVDEDGTLRGSKAVCVLRDGESGEENCGTIPAELSPFERLPGEDEASGFELVGELRGDWPDALPVNVRVADDTAFLATYRDGLRAIDVTNPAAPVEVGHFPVTDDVINDVKLVERGSDGARFALLASGARGVLSVDVTDPRSPELAAVFSILGDGTGVHTLFVEPLGDKVYAYLAGGGNPVVSIFDVTDPAAPVEVGNYRTRSATGVHDLMIREGVMYLCASSGGFEVVDASESRVNPELLGFIDAPDEVFEFSHSVWVDQVGDRLLAVEGGEGIGTNVRVIDVDPASDEFMTVLGTYQTRREVSVHNIQLFGSTAYIAYYQDGLRALDISNPADPVEIGYFNTWSPEASSGALFEGALGVEAGAEDGVVYLADRERGLVVLRRTE